MTTKKKSTLGQNFVTEGRFYAMPLVIEGESYPIPRDESYLNAFTEAPSGKKFFGTTGGSKCHVFAGAAKGNYAGIFDMGVVEDAIDVPVLLHYDTAVKEAYLMEEIIFVANTKAGASIYLHQIFLTADIIQEPSFFSSLFPEIATLEKVRVEDALLSTDKKHLICLSDKGILDVTIKSGKNRYLQKRNLGKAAIRKFAKVNDSFAYFIDDKGIFFELDLKNRSIRKTGITGDVDDNSWGFCIVDKRILFANSSGELFTFNPTRNSLRKIGEAILPNIQCMTVLPDKRVYGVSGSEIGFFFRLDIKSGKSEALGAIATAMGAKRYGFEFSKMVTGKDGEIYLCENDSGGHLWIYSPKILPY